MADLSAESSLSLGDSYQVDENLTEAVDCYAAALSVARENEVPLRIRALSHRSSAFYQLGRFQEAFEDATSALELMTKSTSGLRPGEGEMCHRRAGLSAFKLGKIVEAKEALQQAAQLAALNNRSDVKYKELIQECDSKLSSTSDTTKSTPKSSTAASEDMKTKAKTENTKPVPPKANVEKDDSDEKKKSKETKEKPEKEQVFKTFGTLQPELSVVKAGAKPAMPKYQYYQNDKFMTIAVLEPGITESDVHVNFGTKQLTVIMRKQGIDFTVIANALYTEIDVEKSKVVFKDEKVLVKLKKESEKYEWHELFGKNEQFKPTILKPKPAEPAGQKNRPYASAKDWDKVEKVLTEEEKNEKPEGDSAMNKFFQSIYANASDETRRAMVKSYQTSGGTVLSCNWDEVKEKDYEKERVAPKGMEWKNWEGKKLPMKEDD